MLTVARVPLLTFVRTTMPNIERTPVLTVARTPVLTRVLKQAESVITAQKMWGGAPLYE
jgi:hypothetical protein